MQRLVFILLLSITFLSASQSEAEYYCQEYKQQANYYYSKAQNDNYLSNRYFKLYEDFMEKYNECLNEYSYGNAYQGYKKR